MVALLARQCVDAGVSSCAVPFTGAGCDELFSEVDHANVVAGNAFALSFTFLVIAGALRTLVFKVKHERRDRLKIIQRRRECGISTIVPSWMLHTDAAVHEIIVVVSAVAALVCAVDMRGATNGMPLLLVSQLNSCTLAAVFSAYAIIQYKWTTLLNPSPSLHKRQQRRWVAYCVLTTAKLLVITWLSYALVPEGVESRQGQNSAIVAALLLLVGLHAVFHAVLAAVQGVRLQVLITAPQRYDASLTRGQRHTYQYQHRGVASGVHPDAYRESAKSYRRRILDSAQDRPAAVSRAVRGCCSAVLSAGLRVRAVAGAIFLSCAAFAAVAIVDAVMLLAQLADCPYSLASPQPTGYLALCTAFVLVACASVFIAFLVTRCGPKHGAASTKVAPTRSTSRIAVQRSTTGMSVTTAASQREAGGGSGRGHGEVAVEMNPGSGHCYTPSSRLSDDAGRYNLTLDMSPDERAVVRGGSGVVRQGSYHRRSIDMSLPAEDILTQLPGYSTRDKVEVPAGESKAAVDQSASLFTAVRRQDRQQSGARDGMVLESTASVVSDAGASAVSRSTWSPHDTKAVTPMQPPVTMSDASPVAAAVSLGGHAEVTDSPSLTTMTLPPSQRNLLQLGMDAAGEFGLVGSSKASGTEVRGAAEAAHAEQADDEGDDQDDDDDDDYDDDGDSMVFPPRGRVPSMESRSSHPRRLKPLSSHEAEASHRDLVHGDPLPQLEL